MCYAAEADHANADADEGAADSAYNASVAKHRFDSVAKRIRRLVSKYDAHIETAQWCCTFRAGKKEALVAKKSYLDHVCAEMQAMLGCMADACDESLILTRFMDDEAMDTSLIIAECKQFMAKIEYLFDDGGCFESKGCYAHMAIEKLKKVRVITAVIGEDGRPKQIGGEASDQLSNIKVRCLARLQAW